MVRRFLLAAALTALAVGVYHFATGRSQDVGGASVAAALLLLALGVAVGDFRGGGGGPMDD